MLNSKLVKSTRTLDEHFDNALSVREMKSSGTSDREICRQLAISNTTLQKYKDLVTKTDLETLSPEYQNEKRCELDDQIQTVIGKLSSVERRIETEHTEQSTEINKILQQVDIDDQVKIKLMRYARYPLSDLLELKKLVLQAVDLRMKVWGLDKEGKDSGSIQSNKKIVFNVTNRVTGETDKLNKIADTIISGIQHGAT